MRIAFKIILTLGILVGCNGLYEVYLFDRDVEEYADQYHHILKIKDSDIMYISASSNFPPEHLEEEDPRKISQFLGDYFPEHVRVEAINKPATHAGIYYDYLAFLPKQAEAKVFVVTMNLRSMGPDWVNSELESALQQASIFYNHRPPLVNRLLLSLNGYDDLSLAERHEMRDEQWKNDPLPFPEPQNTVTNWCAVEKWGDWRDPKRQLADQFIKQYGFVVTEENPRVQDFDRICALAKERGYKVVFNLLAENVEEARALVGEDLVKLMKSNANWLIERYGERGFEVVNNLEKLSAEHFTDQDFPTEHYDEVGRKIIATNVVAVLKSEGI